MNTETLNHEARSAFRPTLDRDRPYVLDGEFSEIGAVVRYTYADTGEHVTVPNNWFNRPASVRAAHARSKAERSEQKAHDLTHNPPAGLCREALEGVIDRHYVIAQSYWEEHDRIMAEPGATYHGGDPADAEMHNAA